MPDLAKLRYVFDAIALTRKSLAGRVPLIGFAGSPFTLACYMVEGGGSDDFRRVKSLLYARPELLHRILAVNAEAVTAYLNAQVDAGAQALMLFDTWGGALSDAAYLEFSLAYSKRVLAGLKRSAEGRTVPRILFTKGGGGWLEAMADSGADALGVDWQTSIAEARRRVGEPGRPPGQHGSHDAFRPGSRHRARSAGASWRASDPAPATFSTSATASPSTRLRRASRRSWRPSTRARRGRTPHRWCQEVYLRRCDCLFTNGSFSETFRGRAGGGFTDLPSSLRIKRLRRDAARHNKCNRPNGRAQRRAGATYSQTYPQGFPAPKMGLYAP